MSFRDQSWESRFAKLGDEAEAVFEHVAEDVLHLGFTRFGLNRPPIQMGSVPARLRFTPDYLMSRKFVEVGGFGADQLFKLKVDKMGALHWWNDVHPVSIFVWDTTNGRWCFVDLFDFDRMVDHGQASLGSFPEAKGYFAFPAETLFGYSDCYGELTDDLAA